MTDRIVNVREIAARIKRLRLEHRMKKTVVAAEIGVGESVVWTWENARGLPSSYNLALLAILFDVSTDYLLFGSDLVSSDEEAG